MSQADREAWQLTRTMATETNRPSVRVADIDASTGHAINSYSRSQRVSGPIPAAPWALYLTDAEHQFRFLSFDLDAKEHDSVADAAVLTDILEQMSIDYVTCQSSASNGGRGRHVWIGLRDALEPGAVRQLARVARLALPSLDISPLANSFTGAVRPPGAPHRDGSRSEVLHGNLDTLTRPTTAESDVRALYEMLVDAAQLTEDDLDDAGEEDAAPQATAVDRHGHLYLVQGTRMLPAAVERMLQDGDPGADTSAQLARALAHLARAGHRYADALRLLNTSPVFEHVRSEAVKGSARRIRRDPKAAEQVLARQWRRIVLWVAKRPPSAAGHDRAFEERALIAATVVEAQQERADAAPGRWKSAGDVEPRYFVRGGYSDRLVLDAVCLLVAQSTRLTVEASTRHLSEMTGLGRESCRTALLRLEDEGWIAQAADAEGVRAAFWTLTAVSTAVVVQDRSQVFPPPRSPAGTHLRSSWIQKLSSRLEALTQDVFTAPGSLGRVCGRVLSHISAAEALTEGELSERSGLRRSVVRRSLRRMRAHAIVGQRGARWSPRAADNRGPTARYLRVEGFLQRRKAAYEIERQAWVWWCHELAIWLTDKTKRPRRKRHATQRVLFNVAGAPPDFPMHPRTAAGRMDWRAAKEAVAAGILVDPALIDRAA